MKKLKNGVATGGGKQNGFTLIEVTIVFLLIVIVAGIAVPKILTAVHTYRLRGVDQDFSGIVQACRWRAVQDDRFYSVYFLTQNGALEAYVDIYPQQTNGASGNGSGGPIDSNDPQIGITAEVSPQAQANAPNTSNLQSQILPTGSSVTPQDGSVGTSPVTFGPRGLPCVSSATNGGSVCDAAGGLQAYWVFFQNSTTQAWGAVTVTPAGRIQTWYYNGSIWKVTQM